MKTANYWIWLQKAVGINADLETILEPYDGNPQTFWEAGPSEWAAGGRFRPERLVRMARTSPEEAYDVLALCAKHGVDIVTPDDADYPPALKAMSRYPAVLYTKGRAELLRSPTAVAVVGTRRPSARSPLAAAELAGILSQCGILIVSGGARGIDAAAHAGALNAGGATAAVLGCGIGAKYLPENRVLREIIAANGVLVSEQEPLTEPGPGTFPVRNRIIAGMTAATIVAEAGIKSGSLITAKHAQENGRDVLVLALGVTGTGNRGAEELIRDGAPDVVCARDVLEQIMGAWGPGIRLDGISPEQLDENVLTAEHPRFAPLPAPSLSRTVPETREPVRNDRAAALKPKIPGNLSAAAQLVYACFDRTPLTITELEECLHQPVSLLLGALSELEIDGCLEHLESGKYYFKQDG